MPGRHIAQKEPEHPTSGGFLRDIVFGANDGVVTAIGFLVGISGSISNQQTIVIAGILTVVAGSVSMALGNYLAVKSQKEFYDAMEKIENWEIENKPEVEEDEIREIYTNMGFDRQAVKILTKKVISDKKLWLKVMMRDELGLTKEESPKIAGIIIGFFYLLAGIPPILPFIFAGSINLALSISLTAAIFVMVFIGLVRWHLNKGNLASKILETVAIGIIAAGIGYIGGTFLNLFGISNISI